MVKNILKYDFLCLIYAEFISLAKGIGRLENSIQRVAFNTRFSGVINCVTVPLLPRGYRHLVVGQVSIPVRFLNECPPVGYGNPTYNNLVSNLLSFQFSSRQLLHKFLNSFRNLTRSFQHNHVPCPWNQEQVGPFDVLGKVSAELHRGKLVLFATDN